MMTMPTMKEQASENPIHLPIERHRLAGLGIEDRDAHGRDVDQGLQVGPGPLFVSEGAGVRNRRRRLRREQHQDLFILAREPPSVFLPSEKEIADLDALMMHWSTLEGGRRQHIQGIAERSDETVQVPESQWSRKIT